MDLFLHFRMYDEAPNWQVPLVLNDVQCFDVDNFSSSEVVQTALQAIDVADRAFVYLQLLADAPEGIAMKIISHLKKSNTPILIAHDGRHDRLLPLLERLNSTAAGEKKVKALALQFFSQD